MSVGHIPPPLVKKSGRLTNMCIGEASSKSCFCRNCINAMKRIQCQKPLNGRREGTYKPQMPKQKNGRGRLKVEALKNCGAKGTTNPWPSPGAAAEQEKLSVDTKCTVVQFGRIAWMIVRIVY